MKIIIDNYAHGDSSDAIYFNHHISEEDGYNCTLINERRVSFYDLFDRNNPDVYITSAQKLTKDALMYLSENKNVKLILSVKGVSHRDILEIEQMILSGGVNCPFFISNANDSCMPFTKKIKVHRILESYDTNLPTDSGELEFNINKCIVVDEANEVRNYDDTFHAVSTSPIKNTNVDFTMPIVWLSSVLKNYNEIILTNITRSIPQIFFQAIACGCRVYYDIKDSKQSEEAKNTINNIFKMDIVLNYKDNNKLQDFSELQKAIIENHNSKKRTLSLLSQIPKK